MKRATVFSLVLLICLTMFCSARAEAASAEQVTINNTVLDAEHPYYKNGDGSASYGTAEYYNAYFNAATGTLTVKNLDVTTWLKHGIESSGDLILVLEGSSSIKVTCGVNHTAVYCGVQADNLTVRGNGTLSVDYQSGNYGRRNTYGISATTLTLESGTLQINYAYIDGVSASSVKVTGGKLYAEGGETGLYASRINISGGTVNAFGHDEGIYASRLDISGGIVEVIVPVTTIPSTGIYAKLCNISGGTVKAIGTDRGISSSGLYLSGGAVSVEADPAFTYYDRIGISSPVTCITGGFLKISSGAGAFSAAPTFSSCCSYTLKQGSSAADAATTTVLDLDYESLYVYCDTVGKNHTPVAISGTEPTCTVPGSADSTQCSKCGLYLIGPETLYKSHQYDQQVADEKFLKSAATCKIAAVYYCSCVCGKFSTYASTFSYGEPLPHTPQILSGSAPTCETDGLTDGSRCSVCHTTIVAQNKIPATGHSYSTASFAWAENMTSASAAAQCHCGHEENVVCMLAWDSSVKGKLVVTAAAVFDETTFSESKEIVSSVNDSTITINLPHEITGLKVIAAAYNSNGQMTDCEIPQINGSSIQLTLSGRELRVFFLVDQYCPISPAMVL